MKKYLMMVVVALMATTGVKAQNEEMTWSFMPKVGWNLCTWAGDPDAKWMSGYMGGFEVEYGLSDNVGLVAGLNYSLQGTKSKDAQGDDMKWMLGYTNIPLLVQYYPVKGLALKAGAQLGFLTSKKAKENGVQVDIDKLEAFFEVDAGFRKFDLAIPLGISYEYANFVIDARYNLGLIGIVKGYDKTMRNSVFQFSLGYKIPFSN